MAIDRYLAMTAAEIGSITPLPPNIGWMACHFSPYGTGLSNCPSKLPPDSLLILNDRTPIRGHDPERIAGQLRECVEKWACRGLLLDFQQPGVTETASLVKDLLDALPCPVAVSHLYAAELDCPVFLPPIPLHVPLREYLAHWRGRDIWLELALDGEIITLTAEGAKFIPLPPGESFEDGHVEETLHCHYQITASDDQAQFTLCRTRNDLDALIEESEGLGVTAAVGLWQELSCQESSLPDARLPK